MSTVLVVDDTLFMRNAITTMLEEAGFVVIGEAENGKQAIEQYFKLQPDIVTMDVTMPVMSGLEATKEIVKDDPNAKICVVTALGQQKLILQALKNGAKDFITKPFERERLVSTIRQMIE
ncbi:MULTISPECIES: response regulator [Rummeliibacillus]|uniref:response regulator n=1 Tax=Rummeliibacillus TaxID=648802 RepID=UPI0011B75BD4|nr:MULTISPECIES: response regulator [Rummeliibacillus]MBO2536580.1 response regulator [Rummeliibacillus suwonensis]